MKSPLAPNSAILSSARVLPAGLKLSVTSYGLLQTPVVAFQILRKYLDMKAKQYQLLSMQVLCLFVSAEDLLCPAQTSGQLDVTDSLHIAVLVGLLLKTRAGYLVP